MTAKSVVARLDGKVALVSGGARGLGEAFGRAIVANGGSVVLGDIRDAEGEALAAELGARAAYTHLDVTSSKEWSDAVAFATNKFGRLNVLVNNAGVAAFGTLGHFTEAQWNVVMAINLNGPFLGISAARDALVAAAPSAIVNISSTAGLIGNAGGHAYNASKFGVRGLTKSVALELRPFGVRCNSIHPGPTATPATEGQDFSSIIGPFGRLGTPEEIANLVVYLASDESSFSTGSEFIVDGGQTAGLATIPPQP
jgi:3alpha(or 20beta)-hydroxysteroid dehydrogenase